MARLARVARGSQIRANPLLNRARTIRALGRGGRWAALPATKHVPARDKGEFLLVLQADAAFQGKLKLLTLAVENLELLLLHV